MERQTTPFLVLQFFIFPMAIVAVCVTVFVIFGLIASEQKGPRDLLTAVRAGGLNARWQAAYELSKALQSRSAVPDPKFVDEAIALFEQSGNDDPRVRRYLALALGRIGDKRAAPSLIKVIENEGAEADPDTVLYAAWALGALADPQAVAPLVSLTKSPDREIRKAAYYALGSFPDASAAEALRAGLKDSVEDIRWNAALGLGRHREPEAVPVLLEMLDPVRMARVAGLRSDQREEAMLQAIAVASIFSEPSLIQALEALRDSDPDLKVRDAAREALKSRPRS